MGTDYATAWGMSNTIRWGLVMVMYEILFIIMGLADI